MEVLDLEVLGVAVQLLIDVPGVAAAVRRLFRGLLASEQPPQSARQLTIFDDRDRLVFTGARGACIRAKRWQTLMAWLSWELNGIALGAAAAHLALHAGAVDGPAGTIVFAGHSGAGKSTTVAGMVRAGWGYVTDEVTVIPVCGPPIIAYPRPLGLRPGGLRALGGVERVATVAGDALVPVDVLGHTSQRPRQVAAVILPEYAPGGRTRITPVAAESALVALCPHAFGLRDTPARVLRPLAAMLTTVPCYRLVSGVLEEGIDALNEVLA